MTSTKLARALLRCYPRAWRERYSEEFLALLGDTGVGWWQVIDIVRAASSERVRAVGRQALGVRSERAYLNWRIGGRLAAWLLVGLAVSSAAWFTGNWFAGQGVQFPSRAQSLAGAVMGAGYLRMIVISMLRIRDKLGVSVSPQRGLGVPEAAVWSVATLAYLTLVHSADAAGVISGAAGSHVDTFAALVFRITGFFALIGVLSRATLVDETRLRALLIASGPRAVLFVAEEEPHGNG